MPHPVKTIVVDLMVELFLKLLLLIYNHVGPVHYTGMASLVTIRRWRPRFVGY